MFCILRFRVLIRHRSKLIKLKRRIANPDIVPRIITSIVVGNVSSSTVVGEFVGDTVSIVGLRLGETVGLLVGVTVGEVEGWFVGQGLVQKYAL